MWPITARPRGFPLRPALCPGRHHAGRIGRTVVRKRAAFEVFVKIEVPGLLVIFGRCSRASSPLPTEDICRSRSQSPVAASRVLLEPLCGLAFSGAMNALGDHADRFTLRTLKMLVTAKRPAVFRKEQSFSDSLPVAIEADVECARAFYDRSGLVSRGASSFGGVHDLILH